MQKILILDKEHLSSPIVAGIASCIMHIYPDVKGLKRFYSNQL